MILCADLNTASTSGTVVMIAPSPIAGPPPRIVQLDSRGVLSVCRLDSAGGPRVVLRHTQTAGSTDRTSPPSANLVGTVNQIRLLGELQRDWDGDGAPAPSPLAIRRAIEIVAQLHQLPDEVDPDAVGGIALWFYGNDGRSMMVGVRNDGRSAVCSYQLNSPIPDVKTVRDATSVAALVRTSIGSL